MNNEIKEMNLSEMLFNRDERLLQYILNLQEENDILKRDIEAMKHNYNLLVRCIENGESMTQKFENGLNYQDYKQRIDKAIDKLYCYGEVFEREILKQFQKEMLNILNGGDEE